MPLATILYLALKLEKPVLLEGEAGVGKTDVAKVMTAVLGRRLIRLRCYEGLDATPALYEWNYPKQLLSIKTGELNQTPCKRIENIFSEPFLIRRPLLEAIQSEAPSGPYGEPTTSLRCVALLHHRALKIIGLSVLPPDRVAKRLAQPPTFMSHTHQTIFS